MSAFSALATYLKIPAQDLMNNLGIMGHSLGTGFAIDLATRIKPKKLLLIAPFTSLEALIIYRYGNFKGTLLNLINPENYPNKTKLTKIVADASPPEITIVHGAQDRIIPVEMGRELAAIASDSIHYYELPDMGHPNMFSKKLPLILKLMQP
jgi:pimeloyl-ACP methyl ester carboxylesterase